MSAPDCYACKHRKPLTGDCHSRCINSNARVTGSRHGIENGWFFWPVNFDPTWLVSCDGFENMDIPSNNAPWKEEWEANAPAIDQTNKTETK